MFSINDINDDKFMIIFFFMRWLADFLIFFIKEFKKRIFKNNFEGILIDDDGLNLKFLTKCRHEQKSLKFKIFSIKLRSL